jgi:flagellar hook protein FlgE
MSIFGAMVNSVTGLSAQSYALENIADNIANSQTTGYKRVDTSFQDMVPDYPLRQQVGGSVSAFSRATNGLTGTITSTGVSTNFALNGPGFVAVRDRTDYAGGVPTFSAKNAYTRRGDFEVDKSGYLVNGAGYYLVGYPIDPVSGNVTAGTPDVLKVSNDLVPAKASTTLNYVANLPSTPKTPNYDPATPGSDIWAAAAGTPPATVGPATTPDATSFSSNSVSGQTVTMYDSLGQPVDVEVRWAKVATNAGTGANTWGMYYNSTPGTTVGNSTWTLAGTMVFNNAGQLTSPTSALSIDMSSRGLGTVTMDVTQGQLTQYSDVNGTAKVSTLNQDGYPAGVLDSVSIESDGRIMASYSNGQVKALGQVALAQFNAPNMLKRMSGSAFEETLESGTPLFGANGTTLEGGSLEGSNTDIAQEFSKMIVTQQAYSANTRVVTTAQQMLQDAINIIR